MSIQAITWAFKQQVEAPHLKFILICFANYATEYGTTYCSNRTIQSMTGMDEKTITKWVKKLEATGLLIDTGKRQGDTGKIKVYKIVSFETHPKTVVLNTPNIGDGNTPKNGDSPTPPSIDNLNLKPKIKNNTKKCALQEWEAKAGCQLCVEQMAHWLKDNQFDLAKIRPLIVEFREKCLAGGKQYADFTAAFKVWLREGWLTLKISDVKVGQSAFKHQTIDRGNQI